MLAVAAFNGKLIDKQSEMPQVRQRLIVQIARDATAFSFRFVRESQSAHRPALDLLAASSALVR